LSSASRGTTRRRFPCTSRRLPPPGCPCRRNIPRGRSRSGISVRKRPCHRILHHFPLQKGSEGCCPAGSEDVRDPRREHDRSVIYIGKGRVDRALNDDPHRPVQPGFRGVALPVAAVGREVPAPVATFDGAAKVSVEPRLDAGFPAGTCRGCPPKQDGNHEKREQRLPLSRDHVRLLLPFENVICPCRPCPRVPFRRRPEASGIRIFRPLPFRRPGSSRAEILPRRGTPTPGPRT
jgi:hypothetical protein